jgi:hypothetical protein
MLPVLTVALMLVSAACAPGQQLSTQDIKGLLQSMQGKEMIITLDDGTTVRITVDNATAATDAQQKVGKQVDVKVTTDDKGVKKLQKVEDRGKSNDEFTGKVDSIAADKIVVAGKTFLINQSTEFGDGLAAGITVNVHFITQTDGTLLATEVQTDEGELRFTGKLDSMTADTIVVAGKTFKRNAATRVDDKVAVGKTVRVRFVNQTDGSMLATRVQLDNSGQGNQQFDIVGKIDSITATSVVIDGKTFKIDATTTLEQGLVVGARARVAFNTLADGSMLATKIQIDRAGVGGAAEDKFAGKIDSIAADKIVVAGKTFKITAFTKLDAGLKAGDDVRVQFTTLSDGSAAAIDVESQAAQVENAKVTGPITSMTAGTFVVGGKTIKVNAATKLEGGLAVGVVATVEFTTLADGSLLATEIKAAETESGRGGDNRGGGGGGGSGGGSGSGK